MPGNNPLTFFERVRIISEMLIEERVDRSTFACIPFPLETPDVLPDFVSTNIPCLTTTCDAWSEQKRQTLETAGYTVEVLLERTHKLIEGQLIRASMLADDGEWRTMVPPATQRLCDALDIPERLRRLLRG